MVRVIAKKDFAYRSQAVYAGQAVEMEAIDASIHGRLGDVSLDPQARATYQTRDMVAAQPVQTIRIVMPVVATAIPVTSGLLPPLRNDDLDPPVKRARRPRTSKALSA